MGPNGEQIMLLLQRRFNALREISRLTEELQEAISRNDQVSASLLMEMRAEEMAKVESCQSDIWLMAEKEPEYAPVIRELMMSDPFAAHPSDSFEEQKIFELRQKASVLIKDIQEKDRNMNLRVAGDRSYYAKTNNKRIISRNSE